MVYLNWSLMFVVLVFSVFNLLSAFLDRLFSENLLGKYQEKREKKNPNSFNSYIYNIN